MSSGLYSAIPEPGASIESIRDSVLALKAVVEVLTGQVGAGTGSSVVNSTALSTSLLGYLLRANNLNDVASPATARTNLAVLGIASNLSDVASTAAARANLAVREKLTAARTYFVRTDGSNGNTGLANTAGAAFLTGQKAVDVAAGLDLGGFDVTIKFADGTYAGSLNIAVPLVNGNLIIDGNSSTPSNVVLSATNANAIGVTCASKVTVQNLKLQTATGGSGLYCASGGGHIVLGVGVVFGACATAHILAVYGGYISGGANYTVSGGATYSIYAQAGGVIEFAGVTATYTGTPAFSGFNAVATMCGTISLIGCTFTGAATGQRYVSILNGVINTNGGGATFFPGSVGGATDGFGVYA